MKPPSHRRELYMLVKVPPPRKVDGMMSGIYCVCGAHLRWESTGDLHRAGTPRHQGEQSTQKHTKQVVKIKSNSISSFHK